jgi:hypothetical protein
MTRHRVTLEGKTRTIVTFGHDRAAVGYFITAIRGHARVVGYDGLVDDNNSIDGVVRALVAGGVVDETDVMEAKRILPFVDVEQIDDPQVRLVVEVIRQLRADASR